MSVWRLFLLHAVCKGNCKAVFNWRPCKLELLWQLNSIVIQQVKFCFPDSRRFLFCLKDAKGVRPINKARVWFPLLYLYIFFALYLPNICAVTKTFLLMWHCLCCFQRLSTSLQSVQGQAWAFLPPFDFKRFLMPSSNQIWVLLTFTPVFLLGASMGISVRQAA